METTLTAPDNTLTEYEQQELLREAEQRAINTVARNQGDIRQIATAQKREVQVLFGQVVYGGDGADMKLPDYLSQKVDAQAQERSSRFDNGADVARLPGSIIGLENDADRSVLIDTSMVSVYTPEAMAQEVNDHEFRHKLQKRSNEESTELTDNPEVNKMLELGHTPYREDDAMNAAGWKYTSQAYVVNYKEPVNRVRQYLNDGGESGDQLVLQASLNGKMKQVNEAIRRVYEEN